MQVATRDGAVYSLEHRDLGSHGRVLAISRTGGTDDPSVSDKPMVAGRWYHVSVLNPLPPEIGQQLEMVLDPVLDEVTPIVRRTGMVTSVVGLVEPRDAGAAQPASAAVMTPDGDVSYAAGAPRPFLGGDRKLSKASALFAGVMGAAILFGRKRR